MVRVVLALNAVVATMMIAPISATTFTFLNKCDYAIQLYDNRITESIAPQASVQRELNQGFKGMFRHGQDPQATLAEITIDGGKTWYDIGAIPPGPGFCTSFEDCATFTKKKGFNVPLAMEPLKKGGENPECRRIECNEPKCPDAYLFPKDDTKTRNCPASVPMNIIFCPGGGNPGPAPAPAPQPQPAPAPAPAPQPTAATPSIAPIETPCPGPAKQAGPAQAFAKDAEYQSGVVKSAPTNNGASFGNAKIKYGFTYKGELAGNGTGSYDMVTDVQTCSRQSVTVNSQVGPLSEEVSVVFRGPMELYNIAVFDGSSGGDWQKVSSYAQNGETEGMVFLNNKNIDYNGGKRSPQGFSTADGLSFTESATQFGGILKDASDPSKMGAGPGVQTGAEVHIMTDKKCDGTCKGYYDDNGFHGWNGGKKMFVTKVKMPQGSGVNRPAIWMLNAQVLRSNQYKCNCRGMGPVGGCGELDIAEVIETNGAKDKVTTHYYFYDGKRPAGRDNFAPRPFDAPTTYLTILDDAGEGTVKIVEIGGDDFDFSVPSVAASQIKTWLDAQDITV